MRKDHPLATTPFGVSPDLEAVIGKGPMTRKEASDRLWGYIEENGLADPAKKSSIIADAKLQRVFGGRREVSGREMARFVAAHLLRRPDDL